MFVIRLPNGNLQVPRSATHEGRIIGDAYVEIGPQDADYARLAAQALTEDEVEQRRSEWRAGDAALHREFLEFARLVGDQFWPDQEPGPDSQLAGPVPVGKPIRLESRAVKLAQVMRLGAPRERPRCHLAAERAPRIRGTFDARLACGYWLSALMLPTG